MMEGNPAKMFEVVMPVPLNEHPCIATVPGVTLTLEGGCTLRFSRRTDAAS